MRFLKKLMLVYFIIFFIFLMGPISALLLGKAKFDTNWKNAPHSSTNQSPDPINEKQAILQIFAARSFSWRGAFGVHCWIAVKPKNSDKYFRYEKIGWLLYRHKSAISINDNYSPDALWYGAYPQLLAEYKGKEAENIIAKLDDAVASYQYPNKYNVWPGPNSNSFIAHIIRQVPQIDVALPAIALGKDYNGTDFIFRTPSKTGWQISILGLFGISLAKKEGFEINFMSLVAGIAYDNGLIIKIPGYNDFKIF